ncbi:pectate lyase-like adhesive domain-containing protein [uncultured Methanobrevibacter sp.]|uniref:pectate lyase-like adhesive domain-containing protein n=1 Tax=uncultured Methanobrevibacter sp. TaxID=253161 RepID=UPI0025FCEEC3|nr:pectate lyase-like adhesive domain-containing protein [uncultured Methanobrevibacter sp.]
MIKKTKLLIIALLVLFISLSAVYAQENITAEEIDDAADTEEAVDVESPILGQEGTSEVLSDDSVGTFSELAKLISDTPSGGTISLIKNYTRTDSGYYNGISINKKITINGNGHTIDAKGGSRIFSVSGSNVILNNITFTHANGDVGVGIYVTGSNFKVINSTFKDLVGSGATALLLGGYAPTVQDCKFINNKATYEVASAIFLQGNGGKIINSLFDHNYASTAPKPEQHKDGGTVYIFGERTVIDGCNFTNNVQTRTGGGALYCGGFNGDLKNCRFINNSATNAHGGGASILGHNWNVFNTVFENNTASTYGGGLFFNAQKGKLYNLTFNNNSAHMGGGAYLAYDTAHNTYVKSAESRLYDSQFTNNHAIYGGGAIDAISHFKIDNCDFINNSANNYGGAASIGYSTITNSRFIDNNASFGGAIYSYASEISNSNFTDNKATRADSIYIAYHSELKNNTGDDDVYNPETQGVEITGSHDVQHMLETKSGYYGFCSELYNSNPYTGVYDDSIDLIKNAINGKPVKEYLKILIYRFLDNFDDLKRTGFHNYVWAFTDREYWNSNDPIVKSVIELYDSGFRVPSLNACKVLPNGTLMYINFTSMVTPSSQQNLFLFKFAYGEEIDEVFTKEAILNKTVYIGDTVDYRLVINNKGNLPVYDNWVEDKEHSDGLVYQSWRSEIGNWTYNEQMHRWYLDVLEPGMSASIILTFGVTLEGLLLNNAVSGLGDKNVTQSAAGFEAENPNMTVQKNTVTPKVNEGDQVMFDIVVINTGDVNLKNVFVCESEFDSGLVYVDYVSKVGTWKHSVNKEGKHVFTLTEVLELDDSASFRVIFKATEAGIFSNTVTAGFNDTTLSNSTNTTEVEGKGTPNIPEPNKNDTIKTSYSLKKITSKKENITKNSKQADDGRKAVLKLHVDKKATGNPLTALLLALIFVPIRRFKK